MLWLLKNQLTFDYVLKTIIRFLLDSEHWLLVFAGNFLTLHRIHLGVSHHSPLQVNNKHRFNTLFSLFVPSALSLPSFFIFTYYFCFKRKLTTKEYLKGDFYAMINPSTNFNWCVNEPSMFPSRLRLTSEENRALLIECPPWVNLAQSITYFSLYLPAALKSHLY